MLLLKKNSVISIKIDIFYFIIRGSSETIRRTLFSSLAPNSPPKPPTITMTKEHAFDFSYITENRELLPQHIKKYSQEFLEWFVGFSEGDGCFHVSVPYKRLSFVITQKDPTFLYNLRTSLGFGSVLNDNKNPEIKRYSVTHRSQIKILIHIFNGNLILNKTNQRFQLWVEHYNKLTGEQIQLKESFTKTFFENLLLLKSSWFVGFIEADGCFNVERRGLETCSFRFLLDQKDELVFLEHVKFCLGKGQGSLCSTLKRKTSTDGGACWRYEVRDLPVIERLIKYLSGKTFRTKKHIAFIRWNKLYNLIRVVIVREKEKGTYIFSVKRAERIKRLASELNKGGLENLVDSDEEGEDIVPAP